MYEINCKFSADKEYKICLLYLIYYTRTARCINNSEVTKTSFTF